MKNCEFHLPNNTLSVKAMVPILVSIFLLTGISMFAQQGVTAPATPKTVKGKMQIRPGGPVKLVEVAVHSVPDNLPSFKASQVNIEDEDLILGILIDGMPMAYPIRYLALYEVIDDRVGELPVAPTW